MKRLDYLIFGYRTVRVTDGLSECADIFLKADMPVSFRADGSFDIKESEVNGISEMLDGKLSHTPLGLGVHLILATRKNDYIIEKNKCQLFSRIKLRKIAKNSKFTFHPYRYSR